MRVRIPLRIEAAAAMALLVCLSCADANDPSSPASWVPANEPAAVYVWPPDVVLPLRAQQPLWLIARAAADGAPGQPTEWVVPATWTVSESSVLAVDSDGVVTAFGIGEALIVAQHDGFSDTAHARVIELDFVSVTTGHSNACALTSDGAAYCWGFDFQGQLGTHVRTHDIPAVEDCPGCFPRPVSGEIRFSLVSAGGAGRCGLTGAGVVHCWGYTAGQGYHPKVPTVISGVPPLVDVAVGYDHRCGVSTDGTAYCWGANGRGQLGVGDTLPHTSPVLVVGDQRFRKLSAGDQHTCGLTMEGDVYCWGWNARGATGRDRADSVVAVPSRVPGDHRYIDVTAGGAHSCAITAEHRAVCWGSNGYGKLGNADLCSGYGSPAYWVCQPTTDPVAVTGDFTFHSIVAGSSHTCAITDAGVAYCWGAGGDGQLGFYTPETCSGEGAFSAGPCSTVPAPVHTDLTFRSLDIGGRFTCGMDTLGDAYCWGNDHDAQLGSGGGYPRTTSVSPILVAGQPARLP